MQQCRARIAFADESRFRRHCEALQITVTQADYAEQVELTSACLPVQDLQMRLHDLLAGEVYFMTHEN
jgi:putative IMPACT (imprinted ancient) family translation regulator